MENLRDSKKNLHLLIIMSTITLMAILCELMPSGVLPQMSNTFDITSTKASMLVGTYAISSAIFGIPMITLTVSWNRKRLLFILLLGFSISNLIVSLSPGFELALVGRAIGGVCAGTLWPMITAYGMELVDENDKGRAVAIIMSGITIGMSVGIPFMTWIGTNFGYKISFLILSISIAIIALVCNIKLPKVDGEKRSKGNSPFTMLKNKNVLLVLILTFLAVGANYGLYTFITNLVEEFNYSSVSVAQVYFGIGSIISVLITMKFINRHLNILLIALFITGALTMILFYFIRNNFLINLIFILWGISFGSVSTLFQTATAHQVTEGTAVANSLQSSSFNFSIMIGSTYSGMLIDKSGINSVLIISFFVLIIGGILTIINQKKFV